MLRLPIRIAGLPGDGIGPEVFPFAAKLLAAANQVLGGSEPAFVMHRLPYDASYYLQHGKAWPEGTATQLARDYDAAFLIALGDNRLREKCGDSMVHARTIILDGFRGHSSWFTNLNRRPTRLLHPLLRPTLRAEPVSFRLFALSNHLEELIREDVKRRGTPEEEVLPREIHFHAAFRDKLQEAIAAAKASGEDRVAVLHKGNVLRYSHGPWEKICQEQEKISSIKIEFHLMDSFLEKMVKTPHLLPKTLVTDRAFAALLAPVIEALKEGTRGEIPEDFQLVIGRENTEGMYFRGGGLEGDTVETSVGTQIGRHTATMVQENVLATIDIAQEAGWPGHILHLDDVHPQSYGLWRREGQEVGTAQGLSLPMMHAGVFVATLILRPEALSGRVFAADNLLGDLCGDAAAALVGGLGIAATVSYNTDRSTGKYFFEPLHGSAPDIAGQGKANPTATFLTVGELFRAAGHPELQQAVERTLFNLIAGCIRTPDLGGTATTTAFGEAFLAEFLRVTG